MSVKPGQAQLTAYVVPNLGGLRLQNLMAAHLNRLYGELLASGRQAGKGGLSPTSVRNVHRVIHRALRDALRWDRVTKNVAAASVGGAHWTRATRPAPLSRSVSVRHAA